ncbi:CCA tRNA nucleotidyltransferase [Planococcus shenhongbingii]|uniref:CCA tRNA nucleotidyltransferase n=1 Tax=Planococcus shenhongbingii TaxID=3058398 RepID=A0ABT8N834_9BACL|nr:CCA tRNA nucleotidyltransferase [Planococcus sp. N017]MDN7244035.1 CCA tRNA nucleotidyltransferase [Planococcus sp. N017]
MKTALKVVQTLEKGGFEAYIVGGAVRDLLLGKTPQDIDVATNAAPQEVKTLFSRTIDTGIDHGTVLVLLDGVGIEVTTYRTEGMYSDSRRPDSVEFVQSLEEDLKRRDFTINAMALDKERHIIDPFEGKKDIEKRLIRAVGNPDERFQEDALRMLRAVRFSGQLDFKIDSITLASIRKQAQGIQSVAVERLKNELDKIMVQGHTARSMSYLKESGLTKYLPAGEYFETDWSSYEPVDIAASGWAYMLYRQNREFKDIRVYKFSNEERKLIEQSLKAARLEQWDIWTYYHFSGQQLAIAAALTGVEADIAAGKAALPIQSKSEIAANGIDLMEWSGKKQGPWIRQWIEQMERSIVSGKLKNDKEIIKDWFTNEYHGNA